MRSGSCFPLSKRRLSPSERVRIGGNCLRWRRIGCNRGTKRYPPSENCFRNTTRTGNSATLLCKKICLADNLAWILIKNHGTLNKAVRYIPIHRSYRKRDVAGAPE